VLLGLAGLLLGGAISMYRQGAGKPMVILLSLLAAVAAAAGVLRLWPGA
jgi:hypothetical protein